MSLGRLSAHGNLKAAYFSSSGAQHRYGVISETGSFLSCRAAEGGTFQSDCTSWLLRGPPALRLSEAGPAPLHARSPSLRDPPWGSAPRSHRSRTSAPGMQAAGRAPRALGKRMLQRTDAPSQATHALTKTTHTPPNSTPTEALCATQETMLMVTPK
ncbi:hypothetical protein AAFF_G00171930 [Aldrovandia affinis]|uniref:Uncharacterized protein n=1 Tax=Aldrovandia affinis TaxID=143900 RepID=A0AAD7SZV8_9TELE|nr:hypothetical protein AAFF_G00171930 [Aldrovandia affinis]